MNNQGNKWLYLLALSIIWGSSFILIKKALVGLSPFQMGALRIVFTAIFLFAVGFRRIREIKKPDWKWITLTALAGSFFPPFFFAFAQTEIDSAVAAILNSLTPLNTIITGTILFGVMSSRKQWLGILIGLAGTMILILKGATFNPDQNYWYSLLVLASSLCYALNINMLKKFLQHLSPLSIATGNFVIILIPALIILYATGFFEVIAASTEMQESLLYVVLLSLLGTAIAKVLFNKLISISNPVFAASVTYTMPIMAIFWGLLDGESLSLLQLAGGAVILTGVYLANKNS
ncbi:DMT family transporter [Flavobacteriaceae bacterium M23B6Z8]